MIHKILLFFGVVLMVSVYAYDPPNSGSKEVLVSIIPHKYFVQRIADDLVHVQVLIPPGANSHTYEPSPRQVLFASKADLWFRIGEPMENRTIAALRSHNREINIVDLRTGLDLITAHTDHQLGHFCSGGEDLHFWMSPVQAKIQAQTIADALSKQYPEDAQIFKENLTAFLEDLDRLYRGLADKLSPLKQRTIVVSHPAYSYFCRDFGLTQLSIEFEGKDPSPRQLTHLLETIKKLKIRKIFIQPQFSNKGARLIAKEVGAELILFDPFSEDYLEMLNNLGNLIAEN